MSDHRLSNKEMQELVAPAPALTMCEDCGSRAAVWIVDTQRAEGAYCMCSICAYHSVKNRGMRYVRKEELAKGKSS